MKFLQKALELYDEAATAAHPQIRDLARKLALTAIRAPEIVQLDHLQDLAPVRALTQSDAGLAELLRVFTEETFGALETFVQKHPGFIEAQGLLKDECETKMRLLSLASLGSASKRLPYATIAETLKIGEEAVEPWVIRAIRTKVFEAQMDQLGHVVTVTYASIPLARLLTYVTCSCSLFIRFGIGFHRSRVLWMCADCPAAGVCSVCSARASGSCCRTACLRGARTSASCCVCCATPVPTPAHSSPCVPAHKSELRRAPLCVCLYLRAVSMCVPLSSSS